MKLENINLNLLKTLDTILQTRNISIASKQLGVNQSSVSQNLKQLRDILGDQILVKGVFRTMDLTPFATSIINEVQKTINDIERIFIKKVNFEPSTSTREFHIACSDLPSYFLLPKLLANLEKSAPHIKVKVHHPKFVHPTELFENELFDLVIGFFSHDLQETLKSQRLFIDTPICLASQNHPAFNKPCLEMKDLESYPLIVMHGISSPHENVVDQALSDIGNKKRINVSIAHGISSLIALEGNNFIN